MSPTAHHMGGIDCPCVVCQRWFGGRSTGKFFDWYGWRPRVHYVIRAPSIIEGVWVYSRTHQSRTMNRDQATKYVHRYAADEVCNGLRKNNNLAWHVIPRVQAPSIISVDLSAIEKRMLAHHWIDEAGPIKKEDWDALPWERLYGVDMAREGEE